MKKTVGVFAALALMLAGCDGIGDPSLEAAGGKAGVQSDGSVVVYTNGHWIGDLDYTRSDGGIAVWDEAALGKFVSFASADAGGHSGSKSILVDNEGNPWRAIVVFLREGIETFKMDRLSCYVKVPTANPIDFSVRFGVMNNTAEANYMDGDATRQIPPDGQWHEFTVPVVPKGYERIRFLYFSVPGNAGKLCIDDVKFIPKGK